jgi:hypothetical protein
MKTDAYTRAEERALDAALKAASGWGRTFEAWVAIARGLAAIQARTIRMRDAGNGDRQTFIRLLQESPLAPYLGRTWFSQVSTASKLLRILDRLPEVERWRATLTPEQRLHWTVPTSVYKWCPAFQSATRKAELRPRRRLERRPTIRPTSVA